MKNLLTFAILLISTSLFADITPVDKTIAFSGLESMMESIEANLNSHKLFTNVGEKFVEIHPEEIGTFTMIDSTNPYGFVDDMKDLQNNFTSDEVSNINKARTALNLVKDGAKFVQKFDGSTLVDLPIGMRKDFDGTVVAIVLNSIRIYPTYSALEVFVEIKRPDWPTPLIFYSPDITYSQKNGLAGPSSVGLMGNMSIPLEDGKALAVLKRATYDPIERTFTEGTFLEFGCDGFISLGLSAQLHFSREWLLPVMPDGKIHPTARVITDFSTTIENLDNMIFTISIDEFIVPQCDRVAWQVDSATFDFSETNKKFNFPVANLEYNPTTDGDGFLPTQESWKGIRIEYFSMRWVDTVAAKTQTTMPGIEGYNIIIDHNGFSGLVNINGLLPREEGKLDGWDFSIDYLGIKVIKNEPSYFDFGGELVIPILKKDEAQNDPNLAEVLDYDGYFDFSERNYGMAVSLTEEKEFDMKVFKGKAYISPSTSVAIEYREDDGFGLEATIHGGFHIPGVKVFGKDLSMPRINFENLVIASQKSYIRSVGNWALPDSIGANFLGFGYNVDVFEITGSDDGKTAEMKVIANINISAGDGIYISAGGAFRIQGDVEYDEITEEQDYVWKDINVDMLSIEADLEAVYFAGSIIFFKDNIEWGTGFQGKVELYIKGANEKEGDQPGLGIAALGLFGTKTETSGDSYRYFLVDVLARLGDGITIPNTGMKLKGIGGGVYYRMNQLSVTQDIQEADFNPGDPLTAPDAYTEWMLSSIGMSLSGTIYEASRDVSFGVNATVVIALEGKEEAFNANITFTIQLTSNYGIEFIRIKGVTNFMSPISWTGPSCEGISAAIEMNFVFQSQTQAPGFYASAHMFMNIQEGNKKILVGGQEYKDIPSEYQAIMTNSGNCTENQVKYAGGMEVQLTKEDWFINLGEPPKNNRLSAFAGFGNKGITLDAYLNIGTNIPEAPGLPPHIENLVNLGTPNQAGRATGNGFAFGASFMIDLVNIKYTIFTAILNLEAGFDIALKQYDPIYCGPNNDPLGINFWYSSGQAYAFINAVIKGFGFTLIDVGMAAAIQFQGPKPFFGKGAVSGYYNVAFGLYKGNCHFVFEFGEPCESDEDLSTSYDLIADITPADGGTNIASNSDVIAAFNYPLDQIFHDVDTEGNPVEYKLILKEFKVKDNNNQNIEGEFIQESYFVSFIPEEFFLPNQNYTAFVKVDFKNLTTNQVETTEEKTHSFNAGELPEFIPLNNVAYSSPLNGQFNYFRSGPNVDPQVQLVKGQEYLFTDTESNYFAKIFSDYPGYIAERPLSYNESSNTITFSLPYTLKNGQAYKVILIKKPKPIGGNNPQGPMAIQTINYSNGVTLETNELPTLLDNETNLYQFYFRMSLYNKPKDKYEAISLSNMNGIQINAQNLEEPFGYEELIGLNGLEPSLQMRVDLDNTSFYDDYDYYNTANGDIRPYKGHSGRDDYNIAIKDNLDPERIAQFGNQDPKKAIRLYQENTNQYITSESNLTIINQLRQNNEMYGSTSVYLNYLLKEVAYGDISYYINEGLTEPRWTDAFNELKEVAIKDYFGQCNYIYDCCFTVQDFRDDIKDRLEQELNQSDHILKGGYFLNSDKDACQAILRSNIDQNGNGFMNHSFNEYELSNGNYPIYYRYENPLNNEKQYSSIININRTGS